MADFCTAISTAVPHGHWKTTTLVAALRLEGMTAPMILDGAMNGGAFRAYVRHMLAPSLRAGDVGLVAESFLRGPDDQNPRCRRR